MSIDDEVLLRYLFGREEARRRQVHETLATLTPREARLVREAAVMGFVRGSMAGRAGQTDIPRDSDIVHEVVLGCSSMPEHYRLIAAASEGRRPREKRGDS